MRISIEGPELAVVDLRVLNTFKEKNHKIQF